MKTTSHAVTAALVMALATLLGAPLAAQKTTLRVALQLPLENHLGQNLLYFKQQVEQRSDDITVDIYDSAQLYKDKEIPHAVGSGAIEMGTASLTRFVGDVAAVDVFYQPFLFPSDALVQKATAKGSAVRAPLDAAIRARTGARVLWWQGFGSAIMLSNGAAIESPEKMRGKKVRVFGKTMGAFVMACSGAPMLISGSEQYLAYQRKTVDVGMSGISAVRSRKLWEVMDTITKTQHSDIEFVVVVNERFWRSLPAAHQRIITAAADSAEQAVREQIRQIESTAYAAAQRNGMSIVTPSASDIARWKACSQPVYSQFAEDAGALGEQVMQAARALSR